MVVTQLKNGFHAVKQTDEDNFAIAFGNRIFTKAIYKTAEDCEKLIEGFDDVFINFICTLFNLLNENKTNEKE